MRGGAVDLDFLKHRKAHTVVNVAGLRDVIRAAGFLFTKLVAGETEHHQPLGGIFLVERFEAGVLWREAAMAGGIDDQHHLPRVVGHRNRLSAKAGGGKLMKSAHMRSS